jgi:glycosyltransferase involved in cell wall biosynthesis
MESSIDVVSIIPYKILPAQLGGEKGIALFNQYLASNVRITGIATRNNDPASATNYTLLNILSNDKTKYANLFLYFTIKKIIRLNNGSHLIIEHPYFGWLAWMLKHSMDITWVVHSHNIEYMRSRSIGRWWWRALMWYERWVYKQADVVFFISEDDKAHAINYLNVQPTKAFAITYGIEQAGIPTDTDEAKLQVMKLHNISSTEKILLFNGALYHHTNYYALEVILDQINPGLLNQTIPYKIIICGKGLPGFFNNLASYKDKNIIYAGFVDDISIYFKAADVFLNPIISGGGVKTKAIEAIAMNCTVVSTEIGALGLIRAACGNKLHVVADKDWVAFTKNVELCMQSSQDTPEAFFEYYYWGNIARKVVAVLKNRNMRNYKRNYHA